VDLRDKLGVTHFVATSNVTISIQMAVKALKLKGEIITSPFTWIATLSAIQWEGCAPVFADIDPNSFNISLEEIEKKITPRTVAIMPVHVFGNPCDVKGIEALAQKHGLKVIYDAAHAMGSTVDGVSVLEYGDISATSLHATKLFNTAEGGGCITKNADLAEKLKRIRFFGHDDKKDIVEEGFNGKMTEVHAALGIANLKYYDEVLSERKRKYHLYKEFLGGVLGLKFQKFPCGEPNYSYFPVVFESESDLLEVDEVLTKEKIIPRRYFWPSANTFEAVVPYDTMPESEALAARILCLPLYWKLPDDDIRRISGIVSQVLG